MHLIVPPAAGPTALASPRQSTARPVQHPLLARGLASPPPPTHARTAHRHTIVWEATRLRAVRARIAQLDPSPMLLAPRATTAMIPHRVWVVQLAAFRPLFARPTLLRASAVLLAALAPWKEPTAVPLDARQHVLLVVMVHLQARHWPLPLASPAPMEATAAAGPASRAAPLVRTVRRTQAARFPVLLAPGVAIPATRRTAHQVAGRTTRALLQPHNALLVYLAALA